MPTPIRPTQPLWGTETGTLPLLDQLEARGVTGGTFGAPAAGFANVVELLAESPGGSIVEYLFCSTTLPGGGPDRIPEIVVMVGTRRAGGGVSGVGAFAQIGGAVACNSVLLGSFNGDASVLNPGFLMKCPNKETIPLVGPNDRYWGELYTRVYVPPDHVLQIAARQDQYLEFELVWREIN